MPKSPSELQAAYSDFQEAIKAANARAGTSQGMPEVYKTLQVFLDAWNSDPQLKAELHRRATLVADRTGPDTPYGKAKAAAKQVGRLLRVNLGSFRIRGQGISAAMPASDVLGVKKDKKGHLEEEHHLAESLGQERSHVLRIMEESGLTAQEQELLERWDKEAQVVESEARRLRADGCWYMVHLDWLRAREKLAEGLRTEEARDFLRPISQAAKALMARLNEIVEERRLERAARLEAALRDKHKVAKAIAPDTALELAKTQQADDLTAYVSASKLCPDKGISLKTARDFCRKQKIRTRNPSPRRLQIHAGDWTKHWAGKNIADFDRLDQGDKSSVFGSDEVVLDAAERLKQLQAKRRARK